MQCDSSLSRNVQHEIEVNMKVAEKMLNYGGHDKNKKGIILSTSTLLSLMDI